METNSSEAARIKQSMEVLKPIDFAAAERVLKEIKQILGKRSITFFLRKGTCLGAIRDKALIPWDDDMDIGSMMGYNGMSDKVIERAAADLKAAGYLVRVDNIGYARCVVAVKEPIRMDWMIQKVIDGSTYHWPGVRIPAEYFINTKEIDFLGEKFLVPNPPEEYLRLMYGPEWHLPKKAGSYEMDVLKLIPEDSLPGRAGRLKRITINRLLPWLSTRIKVLDSSGRPVPGATVTVAGLCDSVTDSRGYARFCIPYEYLFSLIIRYEGHEEVLYEENLAPRKTFVYRADASTSSGRNFILTFEN